MNPTKEKTDQWLDATFEHRLNYHALILRHDSIPVAVFGFEKRVTGCWLFDWSWRMEIIVALRCGFCEMTWVSLVFSFCFWEFIIKLELGWDSLLRDWFEFFWNLLGIEICWTKAERWVQIIETFSWNQKSWESRQNTLFRFFFLFSFFLPSPLLSGNRT